MAAHDPDGDLAGIEVDDEDDGGEIFTEQENVTVGALVPTGFPLKMVVGIAVLILAVLAFMDDKK